MKFLYKSSVSISGFLFQQTPKTEPSIQDSVESAIDNDKLDSIKAVDDFLKNINAKLQNLGPAHKESAQKLIIEAIKNADKDINTRKAVKGFLNELETGIDKIIDDKNEVKLNDAKSSIQLQVFDQITVETKLSEIQTLIDEIKTDYHVPAGTFISPEEFLKIKEVLKKDEKFKQQIINKISDKFLEGNLKSGIEYKIPDGTLGSFEPEIRKSIQAKVEEHNEKVLEQTKVEIEQKEKLIQEIEAINRIIDTKYQKGSNIDRNKAGSKKYLDDFAENFQESGSKFSDGVLTLLGVSLTEWKQAQSNEEKVSLLQTFAIQKGLGMTKNGTNIYTKADGLFGEITARGLKRRLESITEKLRTEIGEVPPNKEAGNEETEKPEGVPPNEDEGKDPPKGAGEKVPPKGAGEEVFPKGVVEESPPKGAGEEVFPKGAGEEAPSKKDPEQNPSSLETKGSVSTPKNSPDYYENLPKMIKGGSLNLTSFGKLNKSILKALGKLSNKENISLVLSPGNEEFIGLLLSLGFRNVTVVNPNENDSEVKVGSSKELSQIQVFDPEESTNKKDRKPKPSDSGKNDPNNNNKTHEFTHYGSDSTKKNSNSGGTGPYLPS